MDLLTKLRENIEKDNLIPRGKAVLLAVSGGPDSVALTSILVELRPHYNWRLGIAHVNYQTRKGESAAEERLVKRLAKGYNLPFFGKKFEKNNQRGNLEECFRQFRYDFFNQLAEQHRFDLVATGHQQDDQAETALMFLLRGSQRRGLGGMRRKYGRIVRPMLGVSRENIIHYLKSQELDWAEDSSNNSLALKRNWLRHELLPKIEKECQPQIKRILASNAQIMREEDDFLQELSEKAYDQVTSKERGRWIDRQEWANLPKTLQRRVFLLAIGRLGGNRDKFGQSQVERVLDFMSELKNGKKLSLPGGLQLSQDYDKFLIRPVKKEGATRRKIKVCEGVIYWSEDFKFRVKKVSFTGEDRKAVFYARQPRGGGLYLRNRRLGDRLDLAGKVKGSQKLKKYFIDHKVSRDQRENWPLLVDNNDRVLWLVGLRKTKTIGRGDDIYKIELLSN